MQSVLLNAIPGDTLRIFITARMYLCDSVHAAVISGDRSSGEWPVNGIPKAFGRNSDILCTDGGCASIRNDRSSEFYRFSYVSLNLQYRVRHTSAVPGNRIPGALRARRGSAPPHGTVPGPHKHMCRRTGNPGGGAPGKIRCFQAFLFFATTMPAIAITAMTAMIAIIITGKPPSSGSTYTTA